QPGRPPDRGRELHGRADHPTHRSLRGRRGGTDAGPGHLPDYAIAPRVRDQWDDADCQEAGRHHHGGHVRLGFGDHTDQYDEGDVMPIATVVTRGFGSFGSVNRLPTLGYYGFSPDDPGNRGFVPSAGRRAFRPDAGNRGFVPSAGTRAFRPDAGNRGHMPSAGNRSFRPERRG